VCYVHCDPQECEEIHSSVDGRVFIFCLLVDLVLVRLSVIDCKDTSVSKMTCRRVGINVPVNTL